MEDLLLEINKIKERTSKNEISLSDKERLIFNRAYNFLSRREYSQQELIKKLLQKTEFDQESIKNVVEKLKELNYQSDDRYKEMIIKKLLKKGRASSLITQELGMHGIECDREDIEVAKESLDLSDSDVIKNLIDKKIRQLKDRPHKNMRESIIRALAAKGHSYYSFSKILDDSLKDLNS